jgi:cellulose synthase/poly-beta-1,6-N-acetylglucosamine synthase-like glycosyltransferase
MAVPNEHGGIPQALNLGLARAIGDVLVRVDAHSVLPRGYLRQALTSLATTGAANVGAIQSPVGVSRTQRAIGAAMRHKLGSGAAAYRGSTTLERVDTAFLGAFRIDELRAVGGWDESFERNEDAELNIRLRNEGFEVWLDPALVVEYRPRSSLVALATQYWHYGWWRARTIRKHRTFSARQLIPPAVVATLVVSVLGAVAVSPLLAIVPAGYIAAMLTAALSTDDLTLPERLTMFAALVVMHVSWGGAFIVSTLDPRHLAQAD